MLVKQSGLLEIELLNFELFWPTEVFHHERKRFDINGGVSP